MLRKAGKAATYTSTEPRCSGHGTRRGGQGEAGCPAPPHTPAPSGQRAARANPYTNGSPKKCARPHRRPSHEWRFSVFSPRCVALYKESPEPHRLGAPSGFSSRPQHHVQAHRHTNQNLHPPATSHNHSRQGGPAGPRPGPHPAARARRLAPHSPASPRHARAPPHCARWPCSGRQVPDALQLRRQLAAGGAQQRVHHPARLHQRAPVGLAPLGDGQPQLAQAQSCKGGGAGGRASASVSPCMIARPQSSRRAGSAAHELRCHARL